MNTRNILASAYALVAALMIMLLQGYLYFYDPKLITNLWFGLGLFFLINLFPALVTIRYRQLLQFITFKQAFATYFLTLIIASIIIFLFHVFVLNFVYDTEQLMYLKNVQTEFNLAIMTQNYATSEQLAEAKKLSDGMNPGDFGGLFRQFFTSLLINSVIGLLFSVLIKNKAEI